MFDRRRGPLDLAKASQSFLAWRSPSFIHARADESVGEGWPECSLKKSLRPFHGGSRSPGRIHVAARLLVGERVPSCGDHVPQPNAATRRTKTRASRTRARTRAGLAGSAQLAPPSLSNVVRIRHQPGSGRNVSPGGLGRRGRKAGALARRTAARAGGGYRKKSIGKGCGRGASFVLSPAG